MGWHRRGGLLSSVPWLGPELPTLQQWRALTVRGAASLTVSFSLIWYQNQNHQINIETARTQGETRYTPVTLFK